MDKISVRERDAGSILTKSNLPVADYTVNPYVGCAHACKYCYASFMKRFTGHPEPWGEFVDVKYWKPVRHPEKYAGKDLFLGSVTDPYQPLEETYRRTRAFLEEMQGSGCRISIATKSDLVLRDLDLIQTFKDARVSFSINTLSESFRCDMDAGSSIERRLSAMQTLYEAGIRTTCFISPIFPGITDVRAIIERVRGQCNLIWLENLNLRGSYKAEVLRYIQEEYPELLPLYQGIYVHNDRGYWRALDSEVREYAKAEGLEYVVNDDTLRRPFDSPPVIVNYFYHEQIKQSVRRASTVRRAVY